MDIIGGKHTGNNPGRLDVADSIKCQALCTSDEQCVAWEYHTEAQHCWIYASFEDTFAREGYVFGTRCPSAVDTYLTFSQSQQVLVCCR
jgi:hypothetical protein